MKKCAYFICLIILISCQGCFDIVEQLSLHPDGSGNFQMLVNLSRSKTQINMFQKFGFANKHKIPSKEEIRNRIAEIERTAAKTPGISAVKTSTDLDNYIASINFNFNKLSQVNEVIGKIAFGNKAPAGDPDKYFDYNTSTHIFNRAGMSKLKEEYKKMSTADKAIFTGATYTSVYRFDVAAETHSNASAKLSPDRKSILLRLAANDILKNRSTTENKIQLAK